MSCDTADSHQKIYTVTTGGTKQIKLFRFFVVVFFTKKMRKKYEKLHLISKKRIKYRKLNLFIFDTNITIFLCKVRHVSPSQDVWFCLAAKYLHIYYGSLGHVNLSASRLFKIEFRFFK